jgi:hypothetical protein
VALRALEPLPLVAAQAEAGLRLEEDVPPLLAVPPVAGVAAGPVPERLVDPGPSPLGVERLLAVAAGAVAGVAANGNAAAPGEERGGDREQPE